MASIDDHTPALPPDSFTDHDVELKVLLEDYTRAAQLQLSLKRRIELRLKEREIEVKEREEKARLRLTEVQEQRAALMRANEDVKKKMREIFALDNCFEEIGHEMVGESPPEQIFTAHERPYDQRSPGIHSIPGFQTPRISIPHMDVTPSSLPYKVDIAEAHAWKDEAAPQIEYAVTPVDENDYVQVDAMQQEPKNTTSTVADYQPEEPPKESKPKKKKKKKLVSKAACETIQDGLLDQNPMALLKQEAMDDARGDQACEIYTLPMDSERRGQTSEVWPLASIAY